MTCKDCLHFVPCGGASWDKVTDCPEFTQRNQLVHLPCKVGDIVYCFAPCFDTDHHPKLKVVEKEIIELKIIATVFGLNFDINSIGKTIFLTREEAEKALDKQRETLNGGKISD